jgi:hypothetical protein
MRNAGYYISFELKDCETIRNLRGKAGAYGWKLSFRVDPEIQNNIVDELKDLFGNNVEARVLNWDVIYVPFTVGISREKTIRSLIDKVLDHNKYKKGLQYEIETHK